MTSDRSHRAGFGIALGLLLAMGLAAASTATAWGAGGALRYGRLDGVCPAATATRASCFAVVRVPVASTQAGSAGVQAYHVGAGAVSHGEAGGLTPADLETAYGVDSEGGTGQTVAIVDAYDDPNVAGDLASFDAHYGIHECAECFRKLNQQGNAGPLPSADRSGWSVEISLDVEAVRAICHGCHIVLLEASSASYENLATAVRSAASLGASEISNSYGGPEEGIELTGTASAYEHPGIVITAATGDDGWEDWNLLEEAPNAPATLPDVVAVGGTTLDLQSDGSRESETVWNNYPGVSGVKKPGYATGGGCSALFTGKLWQRRAPGFSAAGCGTHRLAADVSADADPYTGLDVYDSYDYCTTVKCEESFFYKGDWHTVGGTSLASPLIAGMYALAGGSHGAAYPSLSLYGHLGEPSLYDVTVGGSGFCGGEPASICGHPNSEYERLLDCEGATSCDAAPGLDGPSGVGTPNGLEAFRPQLPKAVIEAPAAPREGVASTFNGASSSDPYPGGEIASWRWSWGDGSESSGSEPTHAFAKDGEYRVSLTVTDEYGLSASTTQTVRVAAKSKEEREAQEKEQQEREAKEREAHEKSEREAHERQEREAREHEEREAHEKSEREAHERQEREAREHEEREAHEKSERELKERAERETGEAKEREAGERSQLEAIEKYNEELRKIALEAEVKATAEREARERVEREAATKLASERTLVQSIGVESFKISAVPDVTLGARSYTVSSSGLLTVKLGCPSGETRCSGTISLRARLGRQTVRIAGASFSVAGGSSVATKLRLSHAARGLLARRRILSTAVTIQASDTAGASHTTAATVTLRAARRG
jgi:PKD repeat protein